MASEPDEKASKAGLQRRKRAYPDPCATEEWRQIGQFSPFIFGHGFSDALYRRVNLLCAEEAERLGRRYSSPAEQCPVMPLVTAKDFWRLDYNLWNIPPEDVMQRVDVAWDRVCCCERKPYMKREEFDRVRYPQ